MAKINIGGKVSHEAQYPYQDRDPKLSCQTSKGKWNTGATVTRSLADYRCNEDKLKQLVYQFGAVATGIYASDDSFSNTNKVKKVIYRDALFAKYHFINK
jgi:hypothetical protein